MKNKLPAIARLLGQRDKLLEENNKLERENHRIKKWYYWLPRDTNNVVHITNRDLDELLFILREEFKGENK